jgi:hypothetical protein
VASFPKYRENVKKKIKIKNSQKVTCSIFPTGFLIIGNATMLPNIGKHSSIPNDYYNHKLNSLSSYLFSLYNNEMKRKKESKSKSNIYIYIYINSLGKIKKSYCEVFLNRKIKNSYVSKI